MSTPTAAQIEALLNFLEEHRGLARGNLRSVEGRVTSHRLWEEITTTLNAMGGCTKTTKQWQKVWTDKKYLTKKIAGAARRSASATGGGSSTAPVLSQWELKVLSIMGDGFGEPQTSARVPAFYEVTQETVAATQSVEEDQSQLTDIQQCELQVLPNTSYQEASATHGSEAQNTESTSRRQTRRSQRSQSQPASSVRERLFSLEDRRELREEKRNEELASIRVALFELVKLIQLILEELRANKQ